MLEHPRLAPLGVRTLHRGVAADHPAEHREHQRRLAVRREAVERRAAVVGVPHHRRLGFVAAGVAVLPANAVEDRSRSAPMRAGQDVHVLIEALVHPAVPRLVVAHRHRPPLVPGLMVRGALIGVDHHRVFHAGAGTVLERELRERIREPQRRVKLQRVPGECARIGVARGISGQVEQMHGDRSLPGDVRPQ